jgi:hypothetical protein
MAAIEQVYSKESHTHVLFVRNGSSSLFSVSFHGQALPATKRKEIWERAKQVGHPGFDSWGKKGAKPIKTKKRVTLIIKRMTSKKLFNLLTSSLFFRAAYEEPRPAAQILALQAGHQREEDRGGPGQRRGQNVYLDRKFPIQEQRRYSKSSVLK